MIVAEPGSGKSTSIRTLDPKTTFIIFTHKPPMFKGFKAQYTPYSKDNPKGNYYHTPNAATILVLLDRISKDMPHIKTIVIDDFQYVSAFEFMNRVEEKGFDKFNAIGKNMFLMATKPVELRDDLLVFYLTHPDTTTDGEGAKRIKAKTIGKLVDEKISLEGLFNVVLYGKVKKTKDGLQHVFETVNSGENTARAPMGMFETPEIPNDLEIVRQAILKHEY